MNQPNDDLSSSGLARRAFLDNAKKVALVAPAVAVLLNAPSVMAQAVYGPGAGNGNGNGNNNPPRGNNGIGNGLDPQPPGDPKPNDL